MGVGFQTRRRGQETPFEGRKKDNKQPVSTQKKQKEERNTNWMDQSATRMTLSEGRGGKENSKKKKKSKLS